MNKSQASSMPVSADKGGVVASSDVTTTRPLCVDLDGTLVATDTLVEATVMLLRRRPWAVLALPWWLLRGAAGYKLAVARWVGVDAAGLPYREEVVALLEQARRDGRRTVLATGSARATAEAVAAHLGLFDDVIATEGTTNLTGRRKLAAIRARLGDGPFDYLGDSRADLPVLRAAHTPVLVAASAGVVRAMPADTAQLAPAAPFGSRLTALLLAMRPMQWSKNALLAVPMLVGWRLDDPQRWLSLLVAVAAFCLAASAVYLINDLFDLPSDRGHPTKRRRPLASGRLPLWWATSAAGGLVLLAVGVSAALLPWAFTGVLLLYLGMTGAYSWFLKEQAVLDVLWLAGLYTLRIIAGGEATDVFPSAWLLGFAMFLFLSLALAKRCAELARIAGEGGTDVSGRGYRTSDLPLLTAAGVAAGYMTVVILALYINSETVWALYHRPEILWLVCPLLLLWITRLWLRVHRRTLGEDPLLFALTDWPSYAIGVGVACLAVAAAW